MDIHQLEVFLAVMDAASVTRAAEHVHLSPAAVSLQLHSLADELHTELFVRSGRQLVPTPAATRLAERARSVVKQMHQVKHEFDGNISSDDRPLHFATGITSLVYQLGRPLRMLRKKFPTNEIHIFVGQTEDIVSGLVASRFDLGLITLPVPEENLRIIPLFEEELLLLSPAPKLVRGGHPSTFQAANLKDLPFVLYPKRSNMRAIIDRFFLEIGIAPKVVMEADDTEALKRLVEAGFGHSILPEHALRGKPRFFQTHRIAQHRLVRKQALAMARVDYPRKLTESVADFLLTLPWNGPQMSVDRPERAVQRKSAEALHNSGAWPWRSPVLRARER
jgi:DNA-binding transcriptional LysR family regulator